MRIAPHHPEDLDRLKALVATEDQAVQRDTYRAVLLALQGLRMPQVLERLERPRRTVQAWIYAYRDHGLDGLADRRQGNGRACRLTAAQRQELHQVIVAGPDPQAHGTCAWHAKDVRKLIESRYGQKYGISGVYSLLHRLRLSCLKPRPTHPLKNQEEKRRWLEDVPFGSTRPSPKPPNPRSRSGTRTRPASACKGP